MSAPWLKQDQNNWYACKKKRSYWLMKIANLCQCSSLRSAVRPPVWPCPESWFGFISTVIQTFLKLHTIITTRTIDFCPVHLASWPNWHYLNWNLTVTVLAKWAIFKIWRTTDLIKMKYCMHHAKKMFCVSSHQFYWPIFYSWGDNCSDIGWKF